jgi:hypothetical protein
LAALRRDSLMLLVCCLRIWRHEIQSDLLTIGIMK